MRVLRASIPSSWYGWYRRPLLLRLPSELPSTHGASSSSPLKTEHPLFQQPNPARALAQQIEQQIETSGLQWTFLRPGMFAANAKAWWGPQIRAGNVVRWPYLAVPTAPIDERDIAAVAVRALCEDGHNRAEYVLTGPESLSQGEQVATIGRVIGRSLRLEEISPDKARRELLTVIPAPGVNMLLDAWAAAVGQPAFVTSKVEEITGTRRGRSLTGQPITLRIFKPTVNLPNFFSKVPSVSSANKKKSVRSGLPVSQALWLKAF